MQQANRPPRDSCYFARMKREWVQIVIAVAVIMTAGAVFRVAENPTAIGSLGEWVSGLGAILAAMVALWIADDQRRQANAQFAEERRHATEMANDERRYREALARAERERIEEERRLSDYKGGMWLIRTVAPGIRYLNTYSATIVEQKNLHKEFCEQILSSVHIRHVRSALVSLGPSFFHDPKLQALLNVYVSSWNSHMQGIEQLKRDLDWDDDSIVDMVEVGSLKDTTNALVREIISLSPYSGEREFKVGKDGWAEHIAPF
ncbi:Uncharacterised protein [Brevundimonas diminuta]|nr:Uncharacterised protein [Brevundimonas diminuta]